EPSRCPFVASPEGSVFPARPPERAERAGHPLAAVQELDEDGPLAPSHENPAPPFHELAAAVVVTPGEPVDGLARRLRTFLAPRVRQLGERERRVREPLAAVLVDGAEDVRATAERAGRRGHQIPLRPARSAVARTSSA